MVTFFPTPYPDEIFHSLIARYHMYSGNLSYRHTLLDLFGMQKVDINRHLPSHLGKFLENMSTNILILDTLINNHTLFPYFTSFKSKEEREKVKISMVNGNTNPSALAGVSGRAIKSEKYLQHCYKCIEEDISKYGETYWRRIHQIPGVIVCPRHKLPLIFSSKQSFDSRFSYNFYLASKEDFLEEPIFRQINEKDINLLHKYACESEWILSNISNEDLSEFP
ncbi:TniQ family protein [Neobacillus drentensis]|uniref:TniQ family protein n=1 Tax=Neobacillus drentensis TaxID=220684 RepID=UPI003001186F